MTAERKSCISCGKTHHPHAGQMLPQAELGRDLFADDDEDYLPTLGRFFTTANDAYYT